MEQKIKDKLIEEIVSIHGCKTLDEFKSLYEIDITIKQAGWYIKTTYASIANIEPLYASYTKEGIVRIKDPENISQEELKNIKKRVKAKERQKAVLEQIRLKGILAIKAFIHDQFRVPIELIEDSDIKWNYHFTFSIGGAVFSYGGTIINESFEIYDYYRVGSYKTAYNTVKTVTDFYLNKAPYLYSGLNLKDEY